MSEIVHTISHSRYDNNIPFVDADDLYIVLAYIAFIKHTVNPYLHKFGLTIRPSNFLCSKFSFQNGAALVPVCYAYDVGTRGGETF